MLASLRNKNSERNFGIIYNTRRNKFGFIENGTHPPIFFHFSELSDEDKAIVEPGFRVSFNIEPNSNGVEGVRATKLELIGTKSTYVDVEGVTTIDMKVNGFCSIESNKISYIFYSHNLVNDDACKAAGNTVRSGQKVKFDVKMNFKYNPPKPYAVNVRIINNSKDATKDLLTSSAYLVNSRALALCKGSPVRRWTRKPNVNCINFDKTMTNKRSREMSTASLRVMVDAIVRDVDFCPTYETIRSYIQSSTFLDRKLTIEEKRRLSNVFRDRLCNNI